MIEKLQFISQESASRTHLQSIEAACKAGIRWVQLRVKDKPEREMLELAKAAKKMCDAYAVKLIINDYPDLALLVNAFGVHLGKEDMPIQEARKIVGNRIIGATANTLGDIVHHARNGADYVGLGPFRFTRTKEKLSPILGMEGYERILHSCRQQNIHIPIVAIGGIEVADISGLLKTGVQGVAVSSLIARSESPKLIVETIYKEISANQYA